MTTTFVSRHPGAIDWARAEGHLPEDARIVGDFDPAALAAGDLVIGTLPAQIAALICERGARYQHLTLDLPADLRGKELSADEMRACKARLEDFFVQRTSVRPPAGQDVLHLCLASEESLQNLIPALTPDIKASHVIILASERMQPAATRLRQGLAKAGLADSRVEIRSDMPDHDLARIIAYGNRLVSDLLAEHPAARIVFNATGGTKMMASGLMQAMRPCAEIVYCDTAHDRIEYFHPAGKSALKLPVNLLKFDTYLAVQGFKARESARNDAGVRARAEVTRALAQGAPRIERLIGKLNGAAYMHRENRPDKAWLDAPRGGPDKAITDVLLAARLLVPQGKDYLAIADQDAATYLGGGWLEEWCALTAKELETGETGQRLHANRWGINVRIDPLDHPAIPGRDQHALNELDAVIVHRNKLLLIECKSGVQISERGESQDILNKLEVLGKHVGGRLDTKWLLTARRIDRNSQAIQRAEQYRIRIITPAELADLKNLIAQWMRA